MILKGESAEEFNRKADENYEKYKAKQKQNLIDMMEADEKLGLYEKPQQEKGEFQRGVDSVKQELHEQRDWCECGNCEPIVKGGKMCKNSKWTIYYPYKPQPTEDVPKRWVDEVMLAEWMHDTYEEISKEKGWSTQEDCRVLFDDLPEKNKEVMLEVAGRLLDNGISEPTDQQTTEKIYTIEDIERMEIFAVVEYIQMYDSDMWSHWIEEDIRSYHTTKEGAEQALALSPKPLKKGYTESNNGKDGFEQNRYFIKSIEVQTD